MLVVRKLRANRHVLIVFIDKQGAKASANAMNQFGSAVRNLFSSSDEDLSNNNILETAHHSAPIFEKIDPEKYFRITVSIRFARKPQIFIPIFELFQNLGNCFSTTIKHVMSIVFNLICIIDADYWSLLSQKFWPAFIQLESICSWHRRTSSIHLFLST